MKDDSVLIPLLKISVGLVLINRVGMKRDLAFQKIRFSFQVNAIHQAFSQATFSHLDHSIVLCIEGRLDASFEYQLGRGPSV